MVRSPEVIHKTMSAIRGKDTGIEMKLRKALTEAGVRYRIYSSSVIGHPDILLPRERIAIFADSEFWHGYRFEENEAKIKTNRSFWIPKIKRNIERDKEVNKTLHEEGYLVLRYWGFEIEKELDRVISEILEAINKRKEIFDRAERIDKKDYTTMGYLFDGDRVLLLCRNKEKNDVNEGKYIGVGGHMEKGETILQCMKREVKEETGLSAKKCVYLGKLSFINTVCDPERIYVYRIESFDGEMKECDEGTLSWVDFDKAMDLPMWEGDKVFFPFIRSKNPRPFHFLLNYDGDELLDVIGPIYNRKKEGKKNKKKSKNGKKK